MSRSKKRVPVPQARRRDARRARDVVSGAEPFLVAKRSFFRRFFYPRNRHARREIAASKKKVFARRRRLYRVCYTPKVKSHFRVESCFRVSAGASNKSPVAEIVRQGVSIRHTVALQRRGTTLRVRRFLFIRTWDDCKNEFSRLGFFNFRTRVTPRHRRWERF